MADDRKRVVFLIKMRQQFARLVRRIVGVRSSPATPSAPNHQYHNVRLILVLSRCFQVWHTFRWGRFAAVRRRQRRAFPFGGASGPATVRHFRQRADPKELDELSRPPPSCPGLPLRRANLPPPLQLCVPLICRRRCTTTTTRARWPRFG